MSTTENTLPLAKPAPPIPTQLDNKPESTIAEELRKGNIHTEIEPSLARAMSWLFVAGIFSLSILQLGIDAVRGQFPQALELFTRKPSVENFKRYEEDLDRSSSVRQSIQPHLQAVVSGYLGFGNTKGVIGRDGWLFYQPGIDYITGPSILDEYRIKQRRAKILNAESLNVKLDPRPAILEFHEQCAKAGVHLILMPVPDKAMLQSAQLSKRFEFSQPMPPLNNPDYARLVAELREKGVDIFDPTPAAIAPGEIHYLKQDTHWTPEFMESVAKDLAEHVRKTGALPASSHGAALKTEAQSVSRVGDIVDMLKLPPGQTIFRAQSVTIHRVLDAAGQPWQAAAEADVLLLGDSFSNIYSVGAMGWGESAGLVEHLSLNLQRPLDRITRNDAGSHATRELLSRELAKGKNRLAGKKVLVWEFAMRELTAGDWKLIEMKLPEAVNPKSEGTTLTTAQTSKFFVSAAGKEVRVKGTVKAVSMVPKPRSVPYKDHIFSIHLVDVEGVDAPVEGKQALVYMWSMRDNELTPASRHHAGDHMTLILKPWSDVSAKLEAINRSELDSEAVQLEEPNWGEEAAK